MIKGKWKEWKKEGNGEKKGGGEKKLLRGRTKTKSCN